MYSLIKKIFNFNNQKTILCIPHVNCENDKYDIINYTGDNVLSYLHKLKDQNTVLKKFNFILVFYDETRRNLLLEYIDENFNNLNIKLLLKDNRKKFSFNWFKQEVILFLAQSKSKVILTSAPYKMLIHFKFFGQKIFCLNYFTPFKNDYFEKNESGFKNFNIDVCFTTSKLASQITSISERIEFSKFKVTGFPRNDVMLSPRFSKIEIYDKLGIAEDTNLILYVPTHRDYEKNKTKDVRNVLGYGDLFNSNLSSLLENTNSVILVKLHPKQNNYVVHKSLIDRIIVYKQSYDLTLYDIMPYSKLLISDYSSVYFDYILTGGQVIFHFYDFNNYIKTRSLSYDPIESILNGEVCKTENEFIKSLSQLLNQNAVIENNNKLDLLFNKYNDGHSSIRITNHIESSLSLKKI